LVIISKDKASLQKALDIASSVATLSGLQFNASKCCTLHVEKDSPSEASTTGFNLNNAVIPCLATGEFYKYLGTPNGIQIKSPDESTLNDLTLQLNKLDSSLLWSWQKLDAFKTFLQPKLDFMMRSTNFSKTRLKLLDRKCCLLFRKWLHVPRRAATNLAYVRTGQGGAGVTPFAYQYDCLKIVHGFRLLSCKDRLVRTVAWDQLRTAVHRKTGVEPTLDATLSYLNGSTTGVFNTERHDINSTWSETRAATVRAGKYLRLHWEYCKTREELQIRLLTDPQVIVPHTASNRLHSSLRNAMFDQQLALLLAKKDQGRSFHCIKKSSTSNHFIRKGSFTRNCDWKFINRARLNLLPVAAVTAKFSGASDMCPKCGQFRETLCHVITLCKRSRSSRVATIRHNAIQARLVHSLPRRQDQTVVVNRTVPQVAHVPSLKAKRPDIVITNETTKEISIIDVSCPYEGDELSLLKAREHKQTHYAAIKDELQSQGYHVFLDAFLVGTLGSWDPKNEKVLKHLKVNKNYAKLMRKLMVSETIKWTRDMYVEHMTGIRQYVVNNGEEENAEEDVNNIMPPDEESSPSILSTF
jgi:hypothetical protein